MTALSQPANSPTVVSAPRRLRDRLLVAGITVVLPAVLIGAVCAVVLTVR